MTAKSFFVDSTKRKIFNVLEYCEGTTLDQHSSVMSENQVLQLFKQLVEAVVYLHERRVCHRDLKPDNIVIS